MHKITYLVCATASVTAHDVNIFNTSTCKQQRARVLWSYIPCNYAHTETRKKIKKIWSGPGAWSTSKKISSHLVQSPCTIWLLQVICVGVCRRSQTLSLVGWDPIPLGMLPTCHHAEFGRSTSNSIGVYGGQKDFWTLEWGCVPRPRVIMLNLVALRQTVLT